MRVTQVLFCEIIAGIRMRKFYKLLLIYWGVGSEMFHPGQVAGLSQGHTVRDTITHTHTHRQFRVPKLPHTHAFGLWKESGEP